MKTYKIKLVSQTNAAVFIILSLIVFMAGIKIFLPGGLQNTGLALLFVAITFTIVYFLWQKLVTGRTEWMITDDGISMIWVKQFSFTQIENISIKWEEIDHVGKGSDPHYYTLKIRSVTGITIRFYHDVSTTSDDFQDFIKDLNAKIKERKSRSTSVVQ